LLLDDAPFVMDLSIWRGLVRGSCASIGNPQASLTPQAAEVLRFPEAERKATA
jgi:hypothetical protein